MDNRLIFRKTPEDMEHPCRETNKRIYTSTNKHLYEHTNIREGFRYRERERESDCQPVLRGALRDNKTMSSFQELQDNKLIKN